MSLLKRFSYLMSTVAFCAFSLLVYAPAAHANSFPGGNGRIIFYSPLTLNDPNQELYTINPDGSELHQVTTNVYADANPQWAPCDVAATTCKVAFDRSIHPTLSNSTNQHDIYIQTVNKDGTPSGSATVLAGANDSTDEEFDPSWNPAGTQIAYHRGTDGGDFHIWTVSASGGTAVQRTTGTGMTDTEPTWNKDGTELVFTRQYSDSSANPACGAKCIAYVSSTATIGGGDTAQVLYKYGTGVTGGSPQWAPDSDTVTFTVGGNLVKEALGGTSPTQLATGTGNSGPTWSPDGKIIAMASGSGTMKFYSAQDGTLLNTVTIATSGNFLNSNGPHELDWARATVPDSTVHACTTSVNVTCTTGNFTPAIPLPCANGLLSQISTPAQHGTPGYDGGGYSFAPTADYVGTDQYIYSYYDQAMNPITCTVNITVLPNAPDTGSGPKNSLLSIGLIGLGTLFIGVIVKKRVMR